MLKIYKSGEKSPATAHWRSISALVHLYIGRIVMGVREAPPTAVAISGLLLSI